MGFFVMGNHGVNVLCFVHRVAAIVRESGAYAPFIVTNHRLYRRAERSSQAASSEGLAIWVSGRQVTWRKRTFGPVTYDDKNGDYR